MRQWGTARELGEGPDDSRSGLAGSLARRLSLAGLLGLSRVLAGFLSTLEGGQTAQQADRAGESRVRPCFHLLIPLSALDSDLSVCMLAPRLGRDISDSVWGRTGSHCSVWVGG